SQRQSYGRKQPYDAPSLPGNPQSSSTSTPKHTFLQPNVNLTTPFDWLVHLDRPLTNPTEGLQVSGVKPHELTQQFITPTGKFHHLAPGNAPSAPDTRAADARISRALEYLWVGDRNYLAATGTTITSPLSVGGRKPGMVNINTVWDKPVFDALFDAKPAGTP